MTFSAGQRLTAAQLGGGADLYGYKNANQADSGNNTNYVNDSRLLVALPAGFVGRGFLDLRFMASAVAGLKVNFTLPAGATMYVPVFHLGASLAPTNANGQVSGITGAGVAVASAFQEWFAIETSAAGTLQFQWGKNAAEASAVTVLRGSVLIVKPTP